MQRTRRRKRDENEKENFTETAKERRKVKEKRSFLETERENKIVRRKSSCFAIEELKISLEQNKNGKKSTENEFCSS